jgi:hypothetical protein
MGPPPAVAPGGAPMMGGGARLVFGFPLEPGERVLYYKRVPTLGGRVFYLVFGVPMILLLGIGIYLIYLGITHRKQFAYAHVVTNRRMFALDGHGHEMKGMRWEAVVGMNKISTSTGLVRQIGVRNAQGNTCLFDEDMTTLERVISALLQNPGQRETWPEVSFDAHVS